MNLENAFPHSPSEGEENPWRIVASRQVYDNPWISVREDDVIRPDGEPGIYGVVHFKQVAVGIVAIEDEHVYLVGQYRYPLEIYSWEIPKGSCHKDETPLGAAKRELSEETGLSAANWRQMGSAFLSNGACDEQAIWFLATGLTQGASHPDPTERIAVRRVPLQRALEMAYSGEINDALSQLSLMSCFGWRAEGV